MGLSSSLFLLDMPWRTELRQQQKSGGSDGKQRYCVGLQWWPGTSGGSSIGGVLLNTIVGIVREHLVVAAAAAAAADQQYAQQPTCPLGMGREYLLAPSNSWRG